MASNLLFSNNALFPFKVLIVAIVDQVNAVTTNINLIIKNLSSKI